MGEEVPADMDGRVLENIFTEEFKVNNPVRFTGDRIAGPRVSGGEPAGGEKEVQKRLESLGYM